MPRGFEYPNRTEVWIPAAFPDNPFTGTMVFRYIGRLRRRGDSCVPRKQK